MAPDQVAPSERDPSPPVPAAVVAAFGLAGPVVPLDGGQGSSVRVGDAVLKPGADAIEVEWSAGLVGRVAPLGFRLPRPLPARDGRWVVDGWSAVEHVAGAVDPEGRWPDVLAASRALHAALSGQPKPTYFDSRDHRWAVADRVAWDEADVEVGPASAPLLSRLRALRRPVDLPLQLVHGDLSGNVLFAPGLPPAVIDLSPYWRPAAYADAVVVVDALLWWETDDDLVARARAAALQDPLWCQLLLRAAIFRLVSLDEVGRAEDPDVAAQLPLYERVVALLERRTTG